MAKKRTIEELVVIRDGSYKTHDGPLCGNCKWGWFYHGMVGNCQRISRRGDWIYKSIVYIGHCELWEAKTT